MPQSPVPVAGGGGPAPMPPAPPGQTAGPAAPGPTTPAAAGKTKEEGIETIKPVGAFSTELQKLAQMQPPSEGNQLVPGAVAPNAASATPTPGAPGQTPGSETPQPTTEGALSTEQLSSLPPGGTAAADGKRPEQQAGSKGEIASLLGHDQNKKDLMQQQVDQMIEKVRSQGHGLTPDGDGIKIEMTEAGG